MLRLLKRFSKAFSVVVDETSTVTGSLVVGVVNGLWVLLDPNPVKTMSSCEVVKGVSVLLPLLPTGINGFLLGKSKLILLRPRNRLFARPVCFLSNSEKKIVIELPVIKRGIGYLPESVQASLKFLKSLQ